MRDVAPASAWRELLATLTQREAFRAYTVARVISLLTTGAYAEEVTLDLTVEGMRDLLPHLDTAATFHQLSLQLSDALQTEAERTAHEALNQRIKRHSRTTIRESRSFSFQR